MLKVFCTIHETFCKESSEIFYLNYPNVFFPAKFLSGNVECTFDNGSYKVYRALINFLSNVREKHKFISVGETNSQNVQL